jgi:hypothetical protein
VAELRATLMRAAGLDPDAAHTGDRLIYLARRGETRRPMAEAEQLISIAEELGFEIVAAETLSLLDQVRLFARARGIAGPPGAAFTNLMWAPAGARVLTIFKQDINGPTFFDRLLPVAPLLAAGQERGRLRQRVGRDLAVLGRPDAARQARVGARGCMIDFLTCRPSNASQAAYDAAYRRVMDSGRGSRASSGLRPSSPRTAGGGTQSASATGWMRWRRAAGAGIGPGDGAVRPPSSPAGWR